MFTKRLVKQDQVHGRQQGSQFPWPMFSAALILMMAGLLMVAGLAPAHSASVLTLEGTGSASVQAVGGGWRMTVAGLQTTAALATGLRESGNFEAQTTISQDDAVGLALIAETHGRPDLNNFTSLFVSTVAGVVSVEVVDRQNGVDHVLDNTGQLADKDHRYRYELRGQYSVPYLQTDKQLRIFRDGNAGFFHFYFAVAKQVYGQTCRGWMELAPSHDWLPAGTRFYVCPCVRTRSSASAAAVFTGLRAVSTPPKDQDDSHTGFAAVRRSYHFSGFSGDAVVVTFGRHLPLPSKNLKFVFWSLAAYEPWWQINDHTAFSYEHVETWDNNGLPGCFEPMSDRNRRWSQVRILENDAVRKRICWSYVLINPDYKIPHDGHGTQLPLVEEVYTFYPDGTGTRAIRFKPNLDSGWNNWHELAEYMTIGDSTSAPIQGLADPCTSITDMDSHFLFDFRFADFPAFNADQGLFGRKYEPTIEQWPDMIDVQHFHSGVDAFSTWCNDPGNSVACSGYRASDAITWHNPAYRMCQWPVGREPYQDSFKTPATWNAQVCHASTVGVEMWNDSTPSGHWSAHYKIDPADGRKYREWVSLIGLTSSNNYTAMRSASETWLRPPQIAVLDRSCVYEGPDFREKTLVFQGAGPKIWTFRMVPNGLLVNPVLRLQNWGTRGAVLTVNGVRQVPGTNCEVARTGDDLLVWCSLHADSPITIAVSPAQ